MKQNKIILYISIAMVLSSCSILRKEINKHDVLGLKENIWIELDSAQNHIVIAKYKHGILNGTYKTYHFQGNKSSVGTYRNNVAVGKWLFYFEDGFLYKKVIHNNKGEVIGRALYNPINF